MKRLKKISNINLKDYAGDNAKNFYPQLLRKWVIENMENELRQYPYAWEILIDLGYEGGDRFLCDLYSIADDLYYDLQCINNNNTFNDVINNLKENYLQDWIYEVKKFNDNRKKMFE